MFVCNNVMSGLVLYIYTFILQIYTIIIGLCNFLCFFSYFWLPDQIEPGINLSGLIIHN